MSMEHEYKLGVTFSESVIEHFVRRTPIGEITLTSFPVCKKTSLSRKQCIIELKLLQNSNRKPLSHFQIPSSRTVHSASQRRYTDDVIFGLQENFIISETVYNRRTISTEQNQKTIVGLSESVIRNCIQRPQRIQHHDIISGLQENVIISDTVHDGSKVTIEY